MVEVTKSIDLQKLKEIYGVDLAEFIDDRIAYCKERDESWKFQVIGESASYAELVFSTRYCSYIYKVSKRRKRLISETFIGLSDCEKLLAIMNSLE